MTIRASDVAALGKIKTRLGGPFLDSRVYFEAASEAGASVDCFAGGLADLVRGMITTAATWRVNGCLMGLRMHCETS